MRPIEIRGDDLPRLDRLIVTDRREFGVQQGLLEDLLHDVPGIQGHLLAGGEEEIIGILIREIRDVPSEISRKSGGTSTFRMEVLVFGESMQ